MATYIYEYDNWPEFTWNDKQINVILGKVRIYKGKFTDKWEHLDFQLRKKQFYLL
jgi:hypothetical protein